VLSSSLLRYILKRVLVYLITIWAAFTVVFFFLRLIPGDPFSRYLQTLYDRYTYVYIQDYELSLERYKQAYGLDKDLFTQYINYLKEVFLKFNLGPSFINFPRPAQELILPRLGWSIGLLGVSTIIAWVIGIVVGVFVGWKRGSKIDRATFTFALCISRVPFYLTALLLALVFAYMLQIFPRRYAYSPGITPSLSLEFILDVIHHATLPALSVILVASFGWIISSRALTITILGEDYLLFAKAKGLKKTRILKRYLLRNLLLPQVTGVAMSLGSIVNGFYLIEWIFNYPGIGGLLAQAMGMLDYNVAQGIILISIFAVLTANLIVDIIYPLIDPRIKGGS